MNHLSASSIEMFCKCQRQWAFRYVEGLKSPPGVALVTGMSVHESAEHNYAYKIETQEDLPVDEVLDVARDSFTKESEQIEDWAGEKPGEALDAAVGLAGLYHRELAPEVIPSDVEVEFVLERPEWEIPMLGYKDVTTPKGTIDIKTTGKRKSQSDLEDSIQAGLYLLDAHTKGEPERFEWQVAVKTKTPATQVLVREKIDHDHTVRFVAGVQESVKACLATGVFSPTLPSNWWCGERFCGYWKVCEYGGRK